MKVIKYQSKKTYKGKDDKTYHYYGYQLVTDNGQQIGIRCFNKEDYDRLDMVAEYVGKAKQ